MSAIWFQNADVSKLLRAGTLNAEWSVEQLPRVDAVTLSGSGPVAIDITLDTTDRTVTVDGTIKGRLQVTCQRCLDAMSITLDNTLKIALLRNKAQAAFAPAGYEPVLMEQEQICLSDLVEDEILLEIPFASRHAETECGALARQVAKLGNGAPDTELATPFADLGQMLRNDS